MPFILLSLVYYGARHQCTFDICPITKLCLRPPPMLSVYYSLKFQGLKNLQKKIVHVLQVFFNKIILPFPINMQYFHKDHDFRVLYGWKLRTSRYVINVATLKKNRMFYEYKWGTSLIFPYFSNDIDIL